VAYEWLDQADAIAPGIKAEYEALFAELKRSAKVTTVDNGDGTYTHTLSFNTDEPPQEPITVTLINDSVDE
jgi:hypothetical protein